MKCSECDGSGAVTVSGPFAGQDMTYEHGCPECGGTGVILPYETGEMRETFVSLVAEVRAGRWKTLCELQLWLSSDASTYAGRMVHFAEEAWTAGTATT